MKSKNIERKERESERVREKKKEVRTNQRRKDINKPTSRLHTENRRHDERDTQKKTRCIYIWDNQRTQCISAEENNGYFRELKSFANIYFHLFFSIQMLLFVFEWCALAFFYIYGCAFGCHLLATVK